MGFDDNKKEGKEESAPVCETKKGGIADSDSEIEHGVPENKVSRQMSESSMYTTEDEDEDENTNKIELGPQCTLKEQFEKDKFLDDDNKCYLEINYTFDIKKEWQAI